MGNGISQPLKEQSVALNILAKFSLVLSKTKDALLADLKANFPDQDITIDELGDFLNNIINQLGFDLTEIPESQFNTTILNVLDASESLGDLLSKIDVLYDFANQIQNNGQIDEPETDLFFEDIEVLTFKTIDIIREFREIGRAGIEQQAEQWQRFIQKSKFDKELPKRLFDHVLSSFLKNAGEIFADDVLHLKQLIEEEVDKLSGEIQKLIRDILDEIEEIERLLHENIQDKHHQVQKLKRKIRYKIKQLLNEDLYTLNEELRKLLSLLQKFYDLQSYFEKIYAVFEFLQVITQEKIQSIPYQSTVDEIEEWVKTIHQLYVLHWDRIAKLIKNPKEYFKQYFQLEDEIDAEKIMKMILQLARAFGFDIPDFSSLKQMLINLLLRLEDELKDRLKSKFKDEFQQIVNTVKYILSVIESLAVQLREDLLDSFEDLLTEIIQNIKIVYESLQENRNNPQVRSSVENREQIEKILSEMKICETEQKTEQEKQDLLIDILLPVIQKKVQKFEEFQHITTEDWKLLLKNLSRKLGQLITDLHTDLRAYRERNPDTDLIENIAERLKIELQKQTKNLPTNSVELIERIYENPDDLSPRQLFSEFDFYAFFKIIAQEIRQSIFFFEGERYYYKFKKYAHQSFAEILNQSNNTANRFKQSLTNQDLELLKSLYDSFLNEILLDSWKDLVKKVFEIEFQPYVKAIEAATHRKANEVLPETLVKIEEDLAELKDKINPIEEFVEELLPLLKDKTENGIDNFKDGAKFAYQLGKLSYEFIDDLSASSSQEEKKDAETDKEELADSLGISNPTAQEKHLSKIDAAYQLDPGNLFASIRIFDSRKQNEPAENYFYFSICAFVGEKFKDENRDSCSSEKGIYIIPTIKGNLSEKFKVGLNHYFQIALHAIGNDDEKIDSSKTSEVIDHFKKGAVGLFLTKNELKWMLDQKSFAASVQASFSRNENAAPLYLIQSKYLDFKIDDYPQDFEMGYHNKGVFVRYTGEIKKANILLKLKQINSFFDKIIKEDIEAEFDAKLKWDLQRGFYFDGAAALRLDLGFQKKFSEAFQLDEFILECGWKETAIRIQILTSFTAHLGPVKFSVNELGIGAYINVLNENGGLGDFDFKPNFKFPAGMRLNIDADIIKGQGVIAYFEEREEFLGMIQLSIMNTIEAKALMLLAMKMPDGSKGYSFVGLVSVYFVPGIPLGMGFSLTGIGGALGLNRDINTESIQSGVRTGALATVFFVDDVEADSGTMISNLGSFFPIKSDQFFFGILARITYAEKLDIEFGLLITLPKPFRIIIVGAVHAILPDKELALIEINAYFAGIIDFDNKELSFDASLVNSKIAFIEIYGDLALRLSWGSEKVFVLSAGGFHPSYKPDPKLKLGVMKRLGMKLDYGQVKQSLEAYFAITSNTVQFGARVDLFIGVGGATLTGFYGFDCLFQFNPFRFQVEIYAGFKAKYKRWTLASVNLEFNLSGPAQWNVNGKAKFKILFFKVTVKFNKTWGKKQSESQITYIDVYELFNKEYHKIENWKIISSGVEDQYVQLADREENADELILEPFDGLSFEQAAIPLNTDITQYGEGVHPKKYSGVQWLSIRLGDLKIEGIELENTKYDFAPSLFYKLDEKEKLSLPSYKKMDNGIKVFKELNMPEMSAAQTKQVSYNIHQDEISFLGENGFEIVEEDHSKELLQINWSEHPEVLLGNGLRVSRPQNIAFNQALKIGSTRRASGFRKYIRQAQIIQKSRNNRMMENALGRNATAEYAVVSTGWNSKKYGRLNQDINQNIPIVLKNKKIELIHQYQADKDIKIRKTYKNKGIF